MSTTSNNGNLFGRRRGAGRLALIFVCGCLSSLTGCSEEEPSSSEGADPPLECPGELEGARCLKACGLAVETLSTGGVTYVVRSSTGSEQRIDDRQGFYTPDLFTIFGRYLTLQLERSVLSDLHDGDLQPPQCVGLSLPGGDDGFAQYMPGSTFSTDKQHRGMAAITYYSPETQVVEGIFRFEAALLTGGGAGSEQASGDVAVTHIEQGYFRVGRRQ